MRICEDALLCHSDLDARREALGLARERSLR